MRPFSKLLGIGSASVSRHEHGETPSAKHMKIYKQLKDNPELIMDYFEENKDKLTTREQTQTELALMRWSMVKDK